MPHNRRLRPTFWTQVTCPGRR